MTVGIVTVERVLSLGDDLRNSPPTKWAKPLYDGMRSQFSIILLTRSNHEIARWWMKKEGMAQWSQLLCYSDGLFDYPMWRVDQVRSFLADGWEVAFYVDSDADALVGVGKMGVLTLTVSYPTNTVGWRDPALTAPRPWSEVVDTVEGHSLSEGGDDGPV